MLRQLRGPFLFAATQIRRWPGRSAPPSGSGLRRIPGDPNPRGPASRNFKSTAARWAFWLVLAVFGVSGTPPHAYSSGQHSPQQLVEMLRHGGLVMYLRHAATNHAQNDKDLSDFSKCELQRNLSEQGKAESHDAAEPLKRLEIPIGEVFTSPYCRCVDTAHLIFGRFEIVPEMRATFYTNREETKHLVALLRGQLSTMPKPGVNTALIGHTANLRDLTKIWPKPEGVAQIFRPLGDGKFEHLGRIEPKDWKVLTPSQ